VHGIWMMASTAPLRISRPSRFHARHAVCAVKGTNTASWDASSRPRRLYSLLPAQQSSGLQGFRRRANQLKASASRRGNPRCGDELRRPGRFPSVIVPSCRAATCSRRRPLPRRAPTSPARLAAPGGPCRQYRSRKAAANRGRNQADQQETSTNTVWRLSNRERLQVNHRSRKMMVRPANRMLSAILSVFSAPPSARAIILSRKVFSWIRSNADFDDIGKHARTAGEPPIVSSRFANHRRGIHRNRRLVHRGNAFDGLRHRPGQVRSRSPSDIARTQLCTRHRSIVPSVRKRRASVQTELCAACPLALCRALRPWLPRKFANSTGEPKHSVICRLKAKLCFPPNNRMVVTTLPTSTTNMTGFFIMVRGSS